MSINACSPYVRSLVAASLLAACATAHSEVTASDTTAPICDTDCVAVGQWRFNLGVGLGVRLNPLVEGDDTPLIILPEMSYYGRRFFLRNLEVGFTLFESPRHQLNLLATPSYDQMYFNRWDPLNLTFQGSAAAASPATAAPPAPMMPQNPGYTYISVSSPFGAPGADGGAPSAPGGAEQPNYGEGDAGGPSSEPPEGSPAPVEARDDISFSGNVSGNAVIEINGSIVASSGTLSGAEGNTIDVQISAGRVTIDGISASDALSLRSDSGVQLSSVTGDAWLGGAEVARGGVVAVDVAENAFIIRGTGGQQELAEQEVPPVEEVVVPFDAVSKRQMSGLAGLEYSYSANWLSIHLQALQDATSVHHGNEFRAAIVFPVDLASQRLALTLGANHKSRKVLDYYYGIDAAEAAIPAWEYEVRSAGTETLLRLDWQMPLTRQWTLRAKLQYLELPTQITRSPLVAEDYVFSGFVGGVYHF